MIDQADETACIHIQSVNTVRVLTFTINNKVDILASAWRIGSGGAIKDNAGSSGMYAFVNPQSGIVETVAINYNGSHFEKQPDSGLVFKGFKMPFWKDAVSLIEEKAISIHGTTLIAWDIAYSKKGWVMVEANENGAFSILQSNKKEGLKDTLYLYMDKYFNAKAVSK